MNSDNLPVWQVTNAWRELTARIFEGVDEAQLNVTPEWLVNPETNRRLKLDLLYPAIGVAIRFEGLQGKQRRRRLSLEEEAQQRTRDDARVTVCQEHGIQLVVVGLADGKPQAVFQELDAALGRAAHAIRDRDLVQQIRSARTMASTLARKIATDGDLKIYAELWEDRQYRVVEPAPAPTPARPSAVFAAGMEVEHTVFGPGVVLETRASSGDMLITVDFITAGQKTLAASLVGDKLMPR